MSIALMRDKYIWLKYLEIDFSPFIYERRADFFFFAEQTGINRFILYLDEKAPQDAASVSDFCIQAEKKNILCKVVLSVSANDALKQLREKNIQLRIRVSSDRELNSFLAEKCAAPHAEAEFCFDREKQALWNITEAMAKCEKSGIPFVFGCSESFVSASAAEIKSICGQVEVPFPGNRCCLRFTESFFVAADGKIFPCRGMKSFPLCSLREKTLFDFVENSSILNFYRNYTQKIKQPCRECRHFGACAGCRGRAHLFSSDFLSADPGCRFNQSFLDTIAKFPVRDPENYLPHQKPMLMISELTRNYDNVCETVYVVQKDNPFLVNGQLHPAALIEIGAQSMAFLDTFLNFGETLQGMLVEVNKFEYSKIPVRVNDKLLIFGEKIYEMPPWYIGGFKMTAADTGETVATGEIKVCQFQDTF